VGAPARPSPRARRRGGANRRRVDGAFLLRFCTALAVRSWDGRRRGVSPPSGATVFGGAAAFLVERELRFARRVRAWRRGA